MRLALGIFILLFFNSATASKVSFECVPEHAAMLEKKQWVSGTFDFYNFTIKFAEDFTELHGLRDRIDIQPQMNCERTQAISTIRCTDLFNWEAFTFNAENSRFIYIMSSWFGYLSEEQQESSDDFIIAGQCHPVLSQVLPPDS